MTESTGHPIKTEAGRHPLLSWQLAILKVMLLLATGLYLEKPVGSIAGRIALAQKNFGTHSYDIKGHRVYALATGTKAGNNTERGVWVDQDGTFKIAHLPKGEYSLKIRATGFATTYKFGLFVDQGKTTRLSPVAMEILEPSLNIASNTRAFTTTESPRFWINATGASVAKVRIYQFNFLDLLKYSDKTEDQKADLNVGANLDMYKTPDSGIKQVLSRLKPVAQLTRQLNQDDSDWGHAEFKLSCPLAQGDYVVMGEIANPEGKSNWNLTWFTVTNLGLVVKQDSEQFLVRAVNLNSLRPESGVDVSLLSRAPDIASKNLGSATTGADGMATIKFSTAGIKDGNVIAYGVKNKDRAYGGMWISNSSKNANIYQSYFYTERPIYRLGQTIYWKAIIRCLTGDGLSLPRPGTTVKAAIEDPDNNELWSGNFKTNEHGTFNGTWNIPADGKTGAYQMVLTYANGNQDFERFEIAQYRKPEYLVEVCPLTPQVVAGQKIKARIKATYFFGAPVANAMIKYSVYSSTDWNTRYQLMDRPDYYNFFDGFDDQSYDSDSGDFIVEGQSETDASGEALISFDSKKFSLQKIDPYTSDYLNKRYKIQAEVTDISRMSVISSGYCSVTSGDFDLIVEPDNYVVRCGDPLALQVTAINYHHQAMPNVPVTLALKRFIWDKDKSIYTCQQEASVVATTDRTGKVKTHLPTSSNLPTDTYYVCAQAQDKYGNVIYDQSGIWLGNSGSPFMLPASDAEKEPLNVKLDKQVYRPGETARIMISAPLTGNEGVDAIVSIEGTRIFDYKIVPMKATANMIEIPIKPNYAPNAFVSVDLVGKKHQFYDHSEMIKVSPQSHFLTFKIETDKQKYKPGETVHYQIKAVDTSGRPASNVELSLGVVDESIYSIRPETACNIQKFFYKQRPDLVETICSFPEQFSGGPDKIEPAVRKDFRDTASFIPDLLTNKDGLAIAQVKLPDNLTTWRATVRGIDLETDVGSAVNKVISTQDLILRLALPRFYTQGDHGLITAVVHNYTEKPQSVNLTLSASHQFQIEKPLTEGLTVNPDKAERFSWPVKLIQPGKATVMVKAIGQTAGDAMETTLNVNPLGIPAFAVSNGLLAKDPDTVSIPFGLASDVLAGSAKYELGLSASAIGPVLGNFNTLIDYPYGCTEQTMSRLMPSIVAMKLHQALGLPLDATTTKKFSEVYRKSINKLSAYQHSDGGWGWWQDDSSNPYLTSLVLEGLYWLKDAGYSVDSQMLKKGLDWNQKAGAGLYRQLSDPKHVYDQYQEVDWRIDLSKMLYTGSLYRQPVPRTNTDWLLEQVDRLSPEALSYLSLTLSNNGQSAQADIAYRRLLALSNKDGNYMDWDHTKGLIQRFLKTRSPFDYTYRFTGVETTALALRAMLAIDPQNNQAIESTKNWILLQHDKDGWQNTKTTAQVFLVLLEEELAARKTNPANFSLAVDLKTGPLTKLVFNQQNAYAREQVLTPPPPATPQKLTLNKTGSGRLYYNSLLTYFRKLEPGDKMAEKGLPQGLTLHRQFFHIAPSQETSDGKIHFKSIPITDSRVKAGETVLMKIELETPVALPYVMVTAPLPSGGEVVEADPRAQQINEGDKSDSNLEGDWGSWWWTHEDVLDDRLVFFVTNLKSGKSTFHTMVRMEMPGDFQIDPVSLEGMYTRNVRAYSPLDSLSVAE